MDNNGIHNADDYWGQSQERQQERWAAAEQSVIGGLMLDNSRYRELEINEEHFHDQSLAFLFKAIAHLINKNIPADVLTVVEHLRVTTGKDYLGLLGTLAKNTPSAANIVAYADIVRNASEKRKGETIASKLQETIWTEETAVDNAVRDLMALHSSKTDNECDINMALIQAVDELDALSLSGELPGVTTGLANLDKVLSGFRNSDLIVVAGRPSMGKTAFALNCLARCNVPAGFISGEQGRVQLSQRLMSMIGEVNSYRIRSGKMRDDDWPKITNAVGQLAEKKIYINDTPSPMINDIIRQARSWSFNYDIKILFVDYLQLIKVSNWRKQRHEQISEICGSLRGIGREIDIPVVALSQVNRDVEKRPDKRPYMSDLKDAGAIEQDADVIVILYRDEVYFPQTNDKGIAENNVIKHRNGPTGMVKTSWRGEYMRFDN